MRKTVRLFGLILAAVVLLLLLASCDMAALGDLVGGGTTAPASTAPVTTVAPHTHQYTKTVCLPTCTSGGYTEYSCECGDSYTADFVPMTYRHDFVEASVRTLDGTCMGYQCQTCGLGAVQYGKADHFSDTGCYYYATVEHDHGDGYEIVIFGEGDMPDFGEYEGKDWDLLLPDTTSIVIAEGVTSVGENAFRFFGYELEQRVTYRIADSVTRLAPNSLWMKTASLTLGSGVERIEESALVGVQGSVYLPRSVTYLSLRANVDYYYEGTLAELYAIETTRRADTVTISEWAAAENESVLSHFRFFVNATDLSDDEEFWR